MRLKRELPPTAGLPLSPGDYWRSPAETFRDGLTRRFGLPEPLLTCSGTAALVVILKTLRRRKPDRDTVIVPAYTCPLVPLAAQCAGLRAVACDTAAGGIDFDPRQLEALCDERTLAVAPTHLGGRVAETAGAAAIAARRGAFVIEDAAQALGAFSADGKSVGLEGDAGFFSLAAGKGLTTYEGGALVSRDPELRAELAATATVLLRPDIKWTLRRNLELLGYAFLYNPLGLRLAYGRGLRQRLDAGDVERAIGDRFSLADIPLHSLDRLRLRVAANALERLPSFLADGRERAAARRGRLAELAGVSIIGDRPGAEGVWPFFMVLMPGKEQRDRALRRLWRGGLGVTRLFARALPEYDFLGPALAGFGENMPRAVDYPNARELAERMLTVSNTPWLDETAFSLILEELKNSL